MMYCWSSHDPESCCKERGRKREGEGGGGGERKEKYSYLSLVSSSSVFVCADLCSMVVSKFVCSCDEGHCSGKL